MAIAKIDLVCKECGCTFTVRKECYNRRDADNYESWAADHIDTCHECIRKQKVAGLADALEKHGFQLPALEGVSDKQIAYAASVREKYLLDNLSLVAKLEKVQKFAQNPDFAKYCEENGIAIEEGVRLNMESRGLTTVHLMLTSNSAREILDSRR